MESSLSFINMYVKMLKKKTRQIRLVNNYSCKGKVSLLFFNHKLETDKF